MKPALSQAVMLKLKVFTGVIFLSAWSGCSTAELKFYDRFLNLTDTNNPRPLGFTNGVLVDPENKASKLTNSTLSLHALIREGQVGDIRLGMTMEEIVTRWGKPLILHPKCDGGHRFVYRDCFLGFAGNSLSKVRFTSFPTFDQGLDGGSKLGAWRNILGEPTFHSKNAYRSLAVYETKGRLRTALSLQFDLDGDPIAPPALYLDPPLTNWFKPALQ